ncbi:interferon-induced very large GTPase 1-like [Hyperolius riggenbachi]|uniref:interferon-induced very large GTPase 1-like n=1 Tax=Hyperolius riggenbachi TaxID=752182 RepID=UPI0035A33DCD
MKASQKISNLRGEITQGFERNVAGLCDELRILGLITEQEHKKLCDIEEPRGLVNSLMDNVLQKGEPDCEKFLNHLGNMSLRNPALRDVSKQFLEERKKTFQDLVQMMKMEPHLTAPLNLRDILNIGLEDLRDKEKPKTIEDLPWNYLRKLIALNRTARDILLNESQDSIIDNAVSNGLFNISLLQGGVYYENSIHPLDVLCVLLHCSDRFLQQEIVTRMSMCQFSIPLLLPTGDSSHCTLMLWAMRDLVKKWRPRSLANSRGFKEESVVDIPMPIISFVRLGRQKLSKSEILNQVLNPAQLYNVFIDDSMEGGNIERKISDGLVEISWYFPSGKSDVFPEPLTVANLRGDLQSNLEQFMFLTRVSSAVFIFIENISEIEFKLLSSFSNSETQFCFIVTPGPAKRVSTQTLKILQDLSPILQIKQSNVLIYASETNKAAFVKTLQSCIVNLLINVPCRNKVSDFEKAVHGLHIHIDDKNEECKISRELAHTIAEDIKDVAEYKRKTMVLQGDLWKQISKVEKELCRLTHQEGKDTQQYLDELKKKQFLLHKKQHEHELPDGIVHFITAIADFSEKKKQYFLKWMKFELDSVTRNNLSELQAEYKEKCNNKSIGTRDLQMIDQKISDSSLGIEHFVREMGQFYEAECSMVKKCKLAETQKQFFRLPEIAADLLLNGFPLELIDGDASNIPLQWITNVLTQLDEKTGKKCRMRVITVLGVQSTGKSTLLNTMFGLQFPVASGRCTRGAFMTLLKVKENFQEELGCQFIMVIDTEGLKAPELASLEGSYEHDNELATLVIGLSDITIVNISMENATEMKDVLQIVVHAFLRMKEVGKKPKCQFVHQNVSDVSAYDKNMRDRKKLLEQLNEMTKVAAEMEKKSEIKAFSDVMDYDLEKDNWYIPGLWLGVPPMAPVNSGYSEHVYELKKYLLEIMKSKESMHTPLSIPEFISWIESLWNAVKHEKFIFSFRNSLVAEAYNKLSVQFSQWEWEFQTAVHAWLVSTETMIKNQKAESLNENLCSGFKTQLNKLLLKEKNKILGLLENYFANRHENVYLIERYKGDFVLSTEFLSKELERSTLSKFNEALSIQKGKFKIQDVQRESQKQIEGKITDLLRNCREKNQKLSEAELKREFETMWNRTLNSLQLQKLQKQNVSTSILQQLMNDLSNKGSAINQELLRVINTEVSKEHFKMDKKYIESGWLNTLKQIFSKEDHGIKIYKFAVSLIDKCDIYIRNRVSTKEDYSGTYCQELIRMINIELSKQAKNLHFSSYFELDIKRHILGRASREFQKMHDQFIIENDPRLCLEKLKPQYLQVFISTFQEKDMCQAKAKEFCEQCLKPAVIDYVFQHLGMEIVNAIKLSPDNKTLSSRTFFQSFLLKELLEEMSFQKYVEYICTYEKYTKSWILNYIEKKYENPKSLKNMQEHLLSLVMRKVGAALTDDQCLHRRCVSDFLTRVRDILRYVLVIPQNEMKVIAFQNTAPVHQFSLDIQLFLKGLEAQILSELQSMDITSVLSWVTVKPQDELFRKVVGCGEQCPFCSVPCEAGGGEHKEHFATIHRPEGLGRTRWITDKTLLTDICSTCVVSDCRFKNADTREEWHPYKEYRTIYPDWAIQPDPSIESSDYWKYIFVQFNEQFAVQYDAKPADLPDGWKDINKNQALQSLKAVFNEG